MRRTVVLPALVLCSPSLCACDGLLRTLGYVPADENMGINGSGIVKRDVLPDPSTHIPARFSEPPIPSAVPVPVETPEDRDRRQLVTNPEPLLEESNLEIFDKGLVNNYRELLSVDVLNKSHVAVRNLSGTIQWMDANGATFGWTPFWIKGSIVAGDTKRFAKEGGTLLTGGTIQGSAVAAVLVFTHAEPVN